MGVLLFLSSQPVKSMKQIITECLDTPFFVEYTVYVFLLVLIDGIERSRLWND